MGQAATYSLLELNQYIRRVLSLNFEEPLWIECEISQASLSRGHWYLDLIQKDGQDIVAQCQAAMWANVYFFLKKKYPIPPEDILKQGMAVKLKVNVDFHERYGLKLIIEDLDSSFTIGLLEMQRQAILNEIKERGLVRKNADTHLPMAVQRLAVISSPKAAGYKDFVKHIEENLSGYDIRMDLYEAAMQGQQVEAEILQCLQAIEDHHAPYDAVAIIRGGGGRTDLAVFDNLNLALRIARFSLPVLIGIGHEIDQSVLDIVAYASLKTPTAVADFVIERNAQFESLLEEWSISLRGEVMDRLAFEEKRIVSLTHTLQHVIRSRMLREEHALHQIVTMMHHAVRHQVQRHHQKLDHLHHLIEAMDPDKVLARGYTITSHEGETLTRAEQIQHGFVIQTTFINGSVKSKVE